MSSPHQITLTPTLLRVLRLLYGSPNRATSAPHATAFALKRAGLVRLIRDARATGSGHHTTAAS